MMDGSFGSVIGHSGIPLGVRFPKRRFIVRTTAMNDANAKQMSRAMKELRHLGLERGLLSLEGIAMAAEITSKTIRNGITGARESSPKTIAKLAKALGCDPSVLRGIFAGARKEAGK
jgi:hypothetical protein